MLGEKRGIFAMRGHFLRHGHGPVCGGEAGELPKRGGAACAFDAGESYGKELSVRTNAAAGGSDCCGHAVFRLLRCRASAETGFAEESHRARLRASALHSA